MNEIHRSPSLKEQYSQNSSPCWRPDAEPLVRFWDSQSGNCWAFPFYSVVGCCYHPQEQVLSIGLQNFQVVISGPKTEAFFDAFCKQRATLIKADGVDIINVSVLQPGDPPAGARNGQEAQPEDPRRE
jgi:hypothetical protein